MSISVLFSGGAGDSFVIDSLMRDEERKSLETIYWAARGMRIVRPLFEASPSYAHVKHETLPVNAPCPAGQDWGVFHKFGEFASRPFTRSTFLTEPAPVLDDFDLPPKFICIQHQTTDNNASDRAIRDLDHREWARIIQRLEREKVAAVVVNSPEADPPPDHPLVFDAVGATTFAESIAILRRSIGFWGVASCLSVLAAQLFPAEALWIKGPEAWLKSCLHIYFYPHTEFGFVFDHLCDPRPYALDTGMKRIMITRVRVWRNQIVAPGCVCEMEDQEAADYVANGAGVEWSPELARKQEAEANPPVLETATLAKPKRRAVKFGESK